MKVRVLHPLVWLLHLLLQVRSARQTWMEAGPKQTIDRSAGTLARHEGLTEHRLARRLGISHDRLADMSFRLWQRAFSEERDRLAGPDASKQKRGQVSRTLQAELEEALADGND